MIGEIIGQEISANVPKNMKAQVIPQGNSYQAIREGYNLLPPFSSTVLNGITYTKNEDGTITVNGTASADSFYSQNINLEEGDYYLSGSPTGGANNTYYLQAMGFGEAGNDYGSGTTFKVTTSSSVGIRIMIYQGVTVNNLVFKPMIVKGTEKKDYEQYGVSPSLDYPSEVEAIGDNTNLFDGKTELGSYNSSGNKINADGTIRNVNPINVKGINTIIFSCNGEGIAMNVFEYNSENKIIKFTTYQANTVITLNSNTEYINFSRSNNLDVSKIQVQKGNVITPFGYGGVEIVASNKNLLSFEYKAGNGITFDKNRITIIDPTGYLYAGNNTLGGNKFLSGKTINLSLIANGTINGNNNIQFIIHTNKRSYVVSQYYSKGNFKDDLFTKKIVLANDEVIGSITVYTLGTTGNLTIDVQVEISDEATEFIEHEGNTYTMPIQREMLQSDYINYVNKKEVHGWKKVIKTNADDFNVTKDITNQSYQFNCVVENGNQYSNVICNMFKFWDKTWKNTGCFISYNSNFYVLIKFGEYGFSEDLTAEQAKQKFADILAETSLVFYYTLTVAEELDLTEEQTQVLEQLSNLYLYEGINYLYSTDDLSPIFQFSYDKIVNDFKFYLSENGRLIFPNENISFLCSISESSIPSMPEALETSATIAGRDGDVPLSTTYGPMSFELVLYTEDNLTPEEKLKQEIFLNRFCNLIKNNTETFALELAQKFYKIKYNGVLSKENYPKFLRFTLPFKSSKSFAYDVKKYIIYGNSTVESNTIEPTGFECVIKGPAIKPIISLNDYSIEYNNTILDDESLIIDTNNSTAVLVNSEGTRVNAMRYYNHQFPKILNGENELKILSGIDNPENVSISWYDLTL